MPKITKSHTTPHFEKKFQKLSKNIQNIAAKKVLLFEENPRYPSLNTHKLKGVLSIFWSFSINEKIRIMFRFLKDNEVIYYDIDNHNIYR